MTRLAAACVVVVAALCGMPTLAQEPDVAIKPGPARDTVAVTCGMCHSLDYIRMNGSFLKQDGWKAEVTKMRQAYGAPIDDDTADTIIQYLSANYGVPAS